MLFVNGIHVPTTKNRNFARYGFGFGDVQVEDSIVHFTPDPFNYSRIQWAKSDCKPKGTEKRKSITWKKWHMFSQDLWEGTHWCSVRVELEPRHRHPPQWWWDLLSSGQAPLRGDSRRCELWQWQLCHRQYSHWHPLFWLQEVQQGQRSVWNPEGIYRIRWESSPIKNSEGKYL